MADIASSFTKVNDVEVASDAPVTEALNFKYGGNDNYLFDELVAQDARLDLLEQLTANRTDVNYFFSGTLPLTETTLFTTAPITVTAGGGVLFLFSSRATASVLPKGSAVQGFTASIFKALATNTGTATVRFKRDSTSLITSTQSWDLDGDGGIILGNFTWLDTPAAGTYNYSMTWQFSSSVTSVNQSAIGTVTHIVLP